MKNEVVKFNSVTYGKGFILAIAQNHWILPGHTASKPRTTTNHQVAMNAAVAMNRLLGGDTRPAKRMSRTTGELR